MRVTRAYIAGFGTAGSLLAGASILFVMATAFVSYRGWPEVSYTQPTPARVLSPVPIDGVGGSPLSVVVTASPTRVAVATRAPAAPVREAGVAPRHGAPGSGTVVVPVPTEPVQRTPPPASTTTTTPVVAAATPPPASPTGNGGLAAVSSSVTKATSAVGGGVSAVGKKLGTTVTTVTGALANNLSAVSPAVSKLVAGAGQAVGTTVTNVTGAAGSVVSGTGQLAGAVLGGLTHH